MPSSGSYITATTYMKTTNLGSEVVIAKGCLYKSIPTMDLEARASFLSLKSFCEKNNIGIFTCNHLCMHFGSAIASILDKLVELVGHNTSPGLGI